MDSHSASAVAILSTIGAATGALSAVIFYAVCIRRRFPLFIPGGGPLNWFEKDLLERAKETAKASTEKFAELGKVGNILGRDPVNNVKDGIFDNITWQQKNQQFDTISETADNDVPKTPLTPFTPSLLEDTVFSSNERMVVVKVQPKISNGSTLSSTDSDSGYRKQSSWSSSSSLDESGGELQLSLFYDTTRGILSVKLIEARDLKPRELSGNADPYAKIRLLPDRSNTLQTKVHKRTLNPIFDEEFTFEVSTLLGNTLEVLLYDFEPVSQHRALGYVHIPLSSYNETNLTTNPLTLTRIVRRYGAEGSVYRTDPLGELMVSLCYDTATNRLTVIVIRAINLFTDREEAKGSDTYVKVIIFKDGKALKKKRSVICHDAQSPVWNDVLVFDFGDSEILPMSTIEFSVIRTSGQVLARCQVSRKCQKDLFQRVLSGVGASVQWIPLARDIPEADSVEA
ncbi:synaptotagmin-1-like [Chelonus insularis]|uniref:synaptotagmin-1-like n=1 Tax=Chelonus insularis TaxID=460826 RepID=UPI00158B10D6|nr:synaptotagmin-1-like [Chelonus insularis]XP_034934373.1 synaptotagmin-1-like [Chelonus insularis]